MAAARMEVTDLNLLLSIANPLEFLGFIGYIWLPACEPRLEPAQWANPLIRNAADLKLRQSLGSFENGRLKDIFIFS
ncbi:MAG: hypothetical protein EZS28_036812 [Streblomastix strix]|uniref:Uncharacterized protein n=1 Tax=Streblomastix strix TaxID=222440 RepID=A0A5J4UBT8_9EUKA|nr:MAG: hypothetical protein EZS28_036812 [Streblomastix strix]